MPNCPVCGRHLGTFVGDPIFVTPSLSTDQYKGFSHLLAQHIKEIQDERHQQEIDNGVTPLTIFSPINIINFFQNIKQYILELRSSTQKILDVTGMTLHDFLSTDEDGNPMTSKDNWSDPNLEEIKYQCKAIHIEDLRHFISIGWFEKFDITPIEEFYKSEQYFTIIPYTSPYSINGSGNYYFDGDMGLWKARKYYWISWNPNQQGTGHFLQTCYSESDGTTSKRIVLKSNWNIAIIYKEWGIISLSGQPYLYIDVIKNGTYYSATPDTKLSHQSVSNINYTLQTTLSGRACVLLEITFDSPSYFGVSIAYYYGLLNSYWTPPISLTKSEFENFERNIAEDFKSIWGEYPTLVTGIAYRLFSDAAIEANSTPRTCHITTESTIDNIKLSG